MIDRFGKIKYIIVKKMTLVMNSTTVCNTNNNNKPNKDLEGGILTQEKVKTKKPSLYKVLMLNDDYTPMEFVIEVLEKYFGKGTEEATQIMLHVHQKGIGICGVYTYDIAETKAVQVTNYARKYEHPLQLQLEKE